MQYFELYFLWQLEQGVNIAVISYMQRLPKSELTAVPGAGRDTLPWLHSVVDDTQCSTSTAVQTSQPRSACVGVFHLIFTPLSSFEVQRKPGMQDHSLQQARWQN